MIKLNSSLEEITHFWHQASLCLLSSSSISLIFVTCQTDTAKLNRVIQHRTRIIWFNTPHLRHPSALPRSTTKAVISLSKRQPEQIAAATTQCRLNILGLDRPACTRRAGTLFWYHSHLAPQIGAAWGQIQSRPSNCKRRSCCPDVDLHRARHRCHLHCSQTTHYIKITDQILWYLNDLKSATLRAVKCQLMSDDKVK